jgi:integrase
LTGLRQSEILGLSWGDVDFGAHVIRVRQQLGRDGELHATKTEAGRRDVVLSPTLARALREAYVASWDKSAKGLVFVTKERKARNHRVALDVFQTACGNAGIEGRVFHDLRHTFASSLIAAGVDVVFVSRQLGHASPAVTLNVYAHVYDKARRVEQATAALEAVMAV